MRLEYPNGFSEDVSDESEALQRIREDSRAEINRTDEGKAIRFEQWNDFGINGPGWYFAGRLMKTRNELLAEIKSVAAEEIAVETNEGTFGATECCRKTGCGDPKFGNYTIYECVGTRERRVVGCDPDEAPGRARKLDRDDMAARRRHLSELQAQLRAAK